MIQNARGLVLQFHITARCNLRCAHCYQEDYTQDEFRFHELLAVVKQFEELLDEVGRQRAPFPSRGHITLTGGEPFVREDFLDLLEAISAKKERFSFSILTNGTLIDEALAHRLRGLAPVSVQVSIEGDQATNDRIRGPGTFDRAVTALKYLVRAGVPSVISFTEFPPDAPQLAGGRKAGLRPGTGCDRVGACAP